MNSILRITDPIISDVSIDKYEYYEYNPIVGTNLNSVGDIRIDIRSQDFLRIPAPAF